MNPMQFLRRLQQVKELKSKLPEPLGQIAKGFFQSNFRKQGFDDVVVEKWQARKGQILGGIAMISKKSDHSRAILIGKGSGQLKMSIHLVTATFQKIRIESDLPYSKIHNEGLQGRAFGKYNFKMPKRQFMGESQNLNKKIKSKVKKEIKRALLGR
jgi:phage gpG-like protein